MNVVNMDNANIYGCFPVETRQGTSLLHRLFVLALFFAIPLLLHAQDQVTLQFTGKNQNGDYVQLSGVVVENLSQHWQEVLYYPDTILNIGVSGIEETGLGNKGVRLFQNVPNPFVGVTDFALQLPEASNVQLEIYDLNGRMETSYKGTLDQGMHQFRAWLATPQTYLLNARTEKGVVQIMMVNAGHTGQSRIEYTGEGGSLRVDNLHNGSKGNSTMPFHYGDTMSYVGNVHLAGRDFASVPVVQAQYGSELIPLIFTLPLPTVTTEAATAISSTQGQLNGYVVEHPDYPVTERGFLFADNTQFNGAVEYSTGAGSGQFHYTVSNLQLATRYYYQAYAQSAMGITYGDVLYFDTQAEMPTVLTLDVMDVKASKATVTGNVTATGGAYVTHRGVCWSTAQNPTLNDSHTDDGNGLGVFTSHITGLTPDTTYYVRAYATNSVGTVYGVELTFTTQPPFYCGIDTVTDYDGNVYSTIEIGQQCWLKENLRTTHYADGAIIPVGTEVSETTAYRYYPNDNSANVPIYGYLYNWAAVMHGAASSSANPSGVQGICPEGWHVPSETELTQLINFVSSQSQYGCGGDSSNIVKALSSSTGWDFCTGVNACFANYNHPLNNATGFSAIPIGYVGSGYCEFVFVNYKESCFIRSSTEHFSYGTHGAATLAIRYDGINIPPYNVCYATSVRCLLDDSGVGSSNTVTPLVTTAKIEDITSTSVRTGGFVSGSGGTPVTSRGVCWSTTPNPTVNNGHTFDGDGTGGFTSGIAGLVPGTTYYIRAYATNSAGTAYGEQRVFTTTHPINDSILIDAQTCPGADTVTDYDGNIYRTVQIGNQCWMRENLRTTHYADGTEIPAGNTTSNTTAYRYPPHGHESEVTIYGYLYNWIAVMKGDSASNLNPSGVQGICPNGWHVPSWTEWEQLQSYVGSQGQYVCGGDSNQIAKALASQVWCNTNSTSNACAVYNNVSANNATGFSALDVGYFSDSFVYGEARIWSTVNQTAFCLQPYSPEAHRGGGYPSAGFSVRCLRDDSSAIVIPSVTTDTLRDIFFSSATCGGFVVESGWTPVTARGVCWSTSHNPTVNDSHTTNGSGTGSFTSHIDSLYANTTYYVRAYATNSVGTAYGEQQSFTTCDSLICDSTLTDYDGNIYHTVVIGQQCWMRENLRTTHLPNGTAIPVGTTVYYEPYRFIPNNDSSLVSSYGYLYNRYAVMNGCSPSNTNPSGVQGICPTGWHVPSKAEWEQLVHFLGSRVEYRCGCDSNDIAQSLAATSGWQQSIDPCSPGFDVNANNSTGFSALPAGYYSYGPHETNEFSHFWSSTIKSNNSDIYYRIQIEKSGRGVYMGEMLFDAVSVRCLRDDSSAIVIPSVTTDTLSAISISSAICGGFVIESGSSPVSARGVCWSTSHNPTVDDSHTSEGSGTGRFSSNISGLATGTTYYVRAYATNSVGTAYGEERSFTTETSSVAPTQ